MMKTITAGIQPQYILEKKFLPFITSPLDLRSPAIHFFMGRAWLFPLFQKSGYSSCSPYFPAAWLYGTELRQRPCIFRFHYHELPLKSTSAMKLFSLTISAHINRMNLILTQQKAGGNISPVSG
jgi:hypothetical protein